MSLPTDASKLAVNGDRLWSSLMELALIGATPKGGVCRLALTDLDRQGRDLVVSWAKNAGLTITTDKIGNVFMRRTGKSPSLPPIACGSHIDTQPTGGKFDGNYGALAGLEVVRRPCTAWPATRGRCSSDAFSPSTHASSAASPAASTSLVS